MKVGYGIKMSLRPCAEFFESGLGSLKDVSPVTAERLHMKFCDHEPEDLFKGNTARRKVGPSDIVTAYFSTMSEVKVWVSDGIWLVWMPVIAEDFALTIISLIQCIQRVAIGERLNLKRPTPVFPLNDLILLAYPEGKTFVMPELRWAIAEHQHIGIRGGIAPSVNMELLARDAGKCLLQRAMEIADGFSGVFASHLCRPYWAKGSSSATYITSDRSG
jgi:hypothetical protein